MLRILLALLLSVMCCAPALAQEPAPATPTTPPATAEPAAKPDPALLRYLNVRYAAAGRFSADGEWIAFTTNWTGTAQKWRIPVDGGFPQQITFADEPVDFCDYSPADPQLMLLGYAAGGNEKTQLYLTDPAGTRVTPFAVDPAVIHRGGDWSRDGRLISFADNRRDEQYFDIYLADMQTGAQRLLWQRDANLSCGAFSPDGKLMIAYENVSNFDRSAYLNDTQSQQPPLLLTPHKEPARFGSFNWVDNDTLYFLSDAGREFVGLARMRISRDEASWAASALEWVLTPDHDIEDLNVSDDGRFIAWAENVDGFGEMHIATLPGMHELPAPAIPRGVQRVGSFDRQNRYLLLQVSGPEGPTDLYRYELPGQGWTAYRRHPIFGTTREDGTHIGEPPADAVLRLTYSSTGGIDPASFVVPRAVHYKSLDGLEISALLYEPAGEKPAGGWPALLIAHGGPEEQVRPWFDPQTQLYLSKGIAIVLPNVRGSDGFGKTFLHLDDVEKREDSIADYAAARDWLVAQGIADPARIAISGGSYGGYAVLAALTLYPDKWAAGVDSVGIANFVTFLENTAPYRRPLREAEYGSLEHDSALLERISPLHRVDRITAPLLIIHGANDPRVPLAEAQQMYEALKSRGSDVELLVFPDEGHGIARLENRAIAWGRELQFLVRTLAVE